MSSWPSLVEPLFCLPFCFTLHCRRTIMICLLRGQMRAPREPGKGKATGTVALWPPPTSHPQVVVIDAWTISKQRTSLPSSLAPIQGKINVCHLLRIKGSSGSGGRPSKPCGCNSCNTVATHRCPEVNLNTVKWFALAAPGKGPMYWVLKFTFYDSMMHERDKK